MLMIPESQGLPPTLMEELKASTAVFHARLQEVPFFEVLAAGQLPIESYVGLLRAFSIIYGVLEHELESSLNHSVVSVWTGDMRKLPLLQKDLAFFEPRAVADLKESVDVALKIAEEIRIQSLQQPLMLLGDVYVLEGSTLGAAVVRPQFASALRLADDEGLSYLNPYGPALDAHWSRYRLRMNALQLGPDEGEQVLQAACKFFTKITSVFQALYPFKPQSKTYLAASINPEAGRHSVPADPREIQASINAANLCWQRFPYFESRYGERGLRFAKSDGAWLATLCQFDQIGVDQQVRWLGRVLSARGMPTLLLQIHLEILFDELSSAVPEKIPLYEKLLIAATGLRECRCKRIDDNHLQILGREFNQAVGPGSNEVIEHAGMLLTAAVADELNGYTGAVDGIVHWIADASRFPREWIDAVHETLAKAKAYALLLDSQVRQTVNPTTEPTTPPE
jgi:heme oxygenase